MNSARVYSFFKQVPKPNKNFERESDSSREEKGRIEFTMSVSIIKGCISTTARSSKVRH